MTFNNMYLHPILILYSPYARVILALFSSYIRPILVLYSSYAYPIFAPCCTVATYLRTIHVMGADVRTEWGSVIAQDGS